MTHHIPNALSLMMLSVFSSNCSAGETLNTSIPNITVREIEASSGEKAFLPGDYNNDGHIDLIIAEESRDRIVVFVNDGAGDFTRAADYPAGERPTWLTALDFNHDGNTDLAVANHESDTITLLRGVGAASFASAEPSRLPIETKPHSHMIAAADLNDDGVLDLVIDSPDQFGIYVMRGNAQGDLEAPGRGVDVGGAPYLGFSVSDVNHDGLPDIITPNQNTISVLLNRSAADFAFDRVALIPFQSPFAIGAADVNGDRKTDLVVAGEGETPGVVVLSGNGEGQFERTASAPLAEGAKLLATGDVNADGFADSVVTSWNSQIALLIGDTDEPSLIRLSTHGIRNPWGVALADFNGDGRDEIVVGDASSGRAIIYEIELADK